MEGVPERAGSPGVGSFWMFVGRNGQSLAAGRLVKS